MTQIIMINPNLILYTTAYNMTKSMHKRIELTTDLSNLIERFISDHPDCIITIEDLDNLASEEEDA